MKGSVGQASGEAACVMGELWKQSFIFLYTASCQNETLETSVAIWHLLQGKPAPGAEDKVVSAWLLNLPCSSASKQQVGAHLSGGGTLSVALPSQGKEGLVRRGRVKTEADGPRSKGPPYSLGLSGGVGDTGDHKRCWLLQGALRASLRRIS